MEKIDIRPLFLLMILFLIGWLLTDFFTGGQHIQTVVKKVVEYSENT